MANDIPILSREMNNNRDLTSLRDGPTTTTTIFEFISRGPISHFGVPPDDAPNALSTQWNTEKTTKILHLMCHQMPFWCGNQMQNFVGKLWLWLCLGRP